MHNISTQDLKKMQQEYKEILNKMMCDDKSKDSDIDNIHLAVRSMESEIKERIKNESKS